MFGLEGPELGVLVVVIIIIVLAVKIKKAKPGFSIIGSERRCLACGYEGKMKTWLSNYNLPQFITLILLFFYLIPGLIFIGWGWGKHKCPKCGALAKNVPLDFVPRGEARTEPAGKRCPFCAEDIKLEAILCKHCGKNLPA